MTDNTIHPKQWTGKKKQGEIFRLQLFMAEMDLKPTDIQRDTGVKVRTITNNVYENKPIGSLLLRALHARYGVSIDWLLTGTGQMLTPNNKIAETGESYTANNDRTQRIVNFITEWMNYATEEQQIWLETELKFNLQKYKRYLSRK